MPSSQRSRNDSAAVALPEGAPMPVKALRKVSVLVLSWNGRKHLEICLPALQAQEDPGIDWDVRVLDNGSFDDTVEWMRREHPWVRLTALEVNRGFCGGNELLVEGAEDADAVVFLNNDTRPGPDWLARLVAAYREAPGDVAAVSGGIVDWDGKRLDFAQGLLTFDGHAFQKDYRRPLDQVTLPEAGHELLFACGGNMIVDRRIFKDLGGFDRTFFAYLEDVDLGWRLWAAGYRVTFAPDAVVHHRSMATSQALGNANRGFLFERNAFSTVYKNFDDEMFRLLMPAVLMTLIHRNQTLLVQNNPGGELLTLDPYAGLVANTAAPEPQHAVDEEEGVGPAPPPKQGPPRTSLGEKWRGYGPREFVKRAVRKGLRVVLPGWVFADAGPTTHIVDPRTFAQLQATTYLLGRKDELADARARTQARRVRSDRDIFAKFPLVLVPTYPGDEDLFASRAFRELLPDGVPIETYRLDEIMALD